LLNRRGITSIACPGNLSSTINEWCESLAPAEVDLVNSILGIDISTGEEQAISSSFFRRRPGTKGNLWPLMR
jgi:hypothetical protein